MIHVHAETPSALPERVIPTIRRIILPLDGTRLAERAIEPAILLARAFSAEVALVQCYEPVSQLPSGNAGLAFLHRKPIMPLHTASLYLARIEERLRKRGVRTHVHLLQWPAASAIVETARQGSDDLIVMATQVAAADLQRLGSVTADVLDAGLAPVLLVNGDTHSVFAGGASLGGLRVLALDADMALDVEAYAQLLADAFCGTVTCISTARHEMSVAAVGASRTDGQCTIDQLASLARASADVVVLKGSLPLDESGTGKANAAKLLHAAQRPVLVVP